MFGEPNFQRIRRPFIGTVLRFALGDCTNNGSSSKNNSLYIFKEGTDIENAVYYCETNNINPYDAFIVETIRKGTKNEYKRAVHIFPRKKGHYMAGGNYLKVDEMCTGVPYPIAIHDRCES